MTIIFMSESIQETYYNPELISFLFFCNYTHPSVLELMFPLRNILVFAQYFCINVLPVSIRNGQS